MWPKLILEPSLPAYCSPCLRLVKCPNAGFGSGVIRSQYAATTAAKSLQSCPTLRDLTDGSPRGSPVPGILRARTLEWVAVSFSNSQYTQVKKKCYY